VVVVAAVGFWFLRGEQQKANWQQATDYYRRADYNKAAPILINLPLPDDAEQLRIYGQTMQATNHLDKATEAYTKLYQIKKDPFAKLVLGNIYNQQKKYDQAEKAYKELIDANPTYVQAYVNLATVYRLQGHNDKALETAKTGLRNNPNNVVIAELAFSLAAGDWTSEEFKEAKATLERINPDDPLLQD
jgi:tetratricopeptide (TPR) repeat protein